MRGRSSSPAARFSAVMRALLVVCTALLLAFSYSVPGWAATIFDVEKVMSTAPKFAGQAHLLLLQGGQSTYPVRLEYLRALTEARGRMRGAPNTAASLALVIDSKPVAYALSLAGQNVILVSTGMLELIGSDSGMAASLLGKVHAQRQIRYSLSMVSHLRNLAYGTAVIGDNRFRPEDRYVAADTARAAFLRAPLIHEHDARKVFPDPVIGIRGDATVLNLPIGS